MKLACLVTAVALFMTAAASANSGQFHFLGEVIASYVPAQDNGIDSRARQAFWNAVESLVELQSPSLASDSQVRWSSSLRTLAQLESEAADGYLVELALFKLDGETGEEWACAASKRTKRLSSLMRYKLTTFAQKNGCARLALERGLVAELLCASRTEFGRRVEQTRDVPQPDKDGSCS